MNDYCGRSLAEATTSDYSVSLTLTYRPANGMNEAIITPRDFQTFIKQVRNEGKRDGYTTRYLAAGEIGHLKGRAHFHAVLFFRGKNIPQFRYDDRQHWHPWPHGHVFARRADFGSFRYVVKYLLKDTPDAKRANQRTQIQQSWFTASRKPPLGTDYLIAEADRYVAAGLAPQEYYFTIPGQRLRRRGLRTNQHQRFWIHGKARETFMERFLTSWKETHGTSPIPGSPIIEEYLDDKAARSPGRRFDLLVRGLNENKTPLWEPPQEWGVETARLTGDGSAMICRDVNGIWTQRQYDERDGTLYAQRRIDTFGQMREAVRGSLRFAPAHYVHVRPQDLD